MSSFFSALRILYAAVLFSLCVSTAFGQSFLFNRADLPFGSQPGGIAVADFNQDGKLDVAVTDSFAQTVTIFLGQSNGTFKQHASYATGYEPGSVVAGDFNNDGMVDIAVANWVGSSVSIYRGNGNGTFKAAITTDVPYYASALVAADFNKDGKLDLAITSNSVNSVYILLGQGDGHFESPVTYTTPSYTIGIIAEDFNRDGHIDLAIADTYGNDVYVMLGNGDGTFQAGTSFSAGTTPIQLVAGDFNGDGLVDLVVTDGPDCGCAFMSVLLGNGDGTFQPPLTTSIAGAGSIVAGDFNRDHKLDIAIDNGLVSVFLGNGDGTFKQDVDYGSDGSSERFVTGDFNRDGLIDFVVTNFNGNNSTHLSTLLGNGDGTFGKLASYSTGSGPSGIVGADFNGDGKIDLATVNGIDNTVSILLGQSGGKFAKAVNYAVSGAQYAAIVAADLNGDGKLDISTLNYSAGTVSILLNKGNGTFASHKDYPAGMNPAALAAGDFNGDGHADLVVGNQGFGLSLVLADGKGGFKAPIAFGSGLSPSSIAVADFNGDGNLDLATVSGSFSSSSVSILLGKGDGMFASPVNYPSGSGPVAVLARDFNQDGKTDLAVLASGSVFILLGNGDGTFQNSTGYPAIAYASAMFAIELYKPNTLDLVVTAANSFNGSINVLEGDGEGHFGSASTYYAGIGPVAIFGADFDGNGSKDLAVVNSIYSTSAVTVMMNEAVAALFPSSLTFPETTLSTESAKLTVLLSNPGTASIAVNSIKISGTAAGDFTETNNCRRNVAVGKSCTVVVYFEPTQKGRRSATLTFNDNALRGVQTVSLVGTGQ
jgi:hypothetical protein